MIGLVFKLYGKILINQNMSYMIIQKILILMMSETGLLNGQMQHEVEMSIFSLYHALEKKLSDSPRLI